MTREQVKEVLEAYQVELGEVQRTVAPYIRAAATSRDVGSGNLAAVAKAVDKLAESGKKLAQFMIDADI